MAKVKLKIEYRNPVSLKAYDGNARTHSDAQVAKIAASIQQFGFVNPVLVDQDSTVIAGHGRLMAAQLLGMDSVPVVCIGHLSERERRALTLADNRIAMDAIWDMAKLADELSALAESEFNLELTGFSEQELDAFLKDDAGILPASWEPSVTVQAEPEQPKTAPPSEEPAPEEPKSPAEFPETDPEKIEYDYCCPACKYQWSGKPR